MLSPTPKSLLRSALLGAVLALAVLVPAEALGATAGNRDNVPCWKQLLNDWYDGTINKTYPIPCYNDAIHHLPTELKIYSSAKDDIEHARAAAIAGKPAPPESHPGGTPIATTSTGSETVVTTTTTSNGTTIVTTTTTSAKPKKHGLSKFVDQITPGNPDSFPLPLLILGALAILLVVAGGVGMLWQRQHPRDEPPAPA